VICPVSESLEIIKRTIQHASPDEKRQLREAVCGNACELCGRRRLTLILDTASGRFQCFQCLGSATAAPVFVREPGDLSDEDQHFLAELKIVWRD